MSWDFKLKVCDVCMQRLYCLEQGSFRFCKNVDLDLHRIFISNMSIDFIMQCRYVRLQGGDLDIEFTDQCDLNIDVNIQLCHCLIQSCNLYLKFIYLDK
jgi:hypothetical protein